MADLCPAPELSGPDRFQPATHKAPTASLTARQESVMHTALAIPYLLTGDEGRSQGSQYARSLVRLPLAL